MKRVPFNTTLDEDLLKDIRAIADEEGRDINWYLEHLLKDYLADRKKKHSGGDVSALGFPARLASI